MKRFIIAATLAAIAAPIAPALAQPPRQADREYRQDVREANRDYRENVRDARRDRRQAKRDWRQYRSYDYNRLEPGQRAYYADNYYREDSSYRTRRLGRNDRVYRGSNGNYYCRRSDGTTGLIIGAVAGGLLGNALDNGRSSTLGTLLGAGGGALLGRQVDRGGVSCR